MDVIGWKSRSLGLSAALAGNLWGAACTPLNSKTQARVDFQIKRQSSLVASSGTSFELSTDFCYAVMVTGDWPELNRAPLKGPSDPATCPNRPTQLGLVNGLFNKGDTASVDVRLGQTRFDLVAFRKQPKDATRTSLSVDCSGAFSVEPSTSAEHDVDFFLNGQKIEPEAVLMATATQNIVAGDNSVQLLALADQNGASFNCEARSLAFTTQPSATVLVNQVWPVQPQVRAYDDAGQPASGQSVGLSAYSDSTCTTPVTNSGALSGVTTQTFDATGFGSFSGLQFASAGNFYLKAQMSNSSAQACSSLVAVSAGVPTLSLANSSVSVSSSTIMTTGLSVVTLTTKDTNGAALTSGGHAVAFTMSGGTSAGFFGSVTDAGNGTYSATFTGTAAGTALSIGATIDGQSVTSTLPTITVVTAPSAPTVTFGTTQTGSVGSALTISPSTLNNNGAAITACTINPALPSGLSINNTTCVISGTPTSVLNSQSFSVQATNSAGTSAAATFTLSIMAGSVSLAQSLVSVGQSAIQVGTSTTVMLTAKDAAGNPLSSGGLSVSFSLIGGTSTGSFSSTTDLNNGTYTANFTAGLAGSTGQVSATINGTAVTSTLPTMQVLPPPTQILGQGAHPQWMAVGQTFVPSAVDRGFNTPGAVFRDPSGNIYVADSVNNRVQKFNNVGSYIGWIGRVGSAEGLAGGAGCMGTPVGAATPAWCVGGAAQMGGGDGMFTSPNSIWSDGTYLYVADTGNSRIVKVDANTGAFMGWVGKLAIGSFTSGTGCVGLAVGTAAPGWCFGGGAGTGTGDNMFNSPKGIWGDATYLYISDTTNHRVVRILQTDGSKQGWTGMVSSAPTAGASGCTGKTVNLATANWCFGGTSAAGTGDGMFNYPMQIWGDGTNLYVADWFNYRLQRLAQSTGIANGWVGKVATVPSGGYVGCTATAAGSVTPGYCTGGTSSSGTGEGMLSNPQGVTGDGTYVYVSEGTRINRYDVNGTHQGWIGAIGNNTGIAGAAGCSGASNGAFTPGWCTGGTPTTGKGDGMLNTGGGLFAYTGSLWVADVNNHRINQYNSSGGTFAGASGATVDSPNDAWMTSLGSSSSGARVPSDYGFDGNGGIYSDGTFVYVADTNNHRIKKFNLSTGSLVGWIGKVFQTPTSGAASCNVATVGSFTPGWCVGGLSTSGSGDGMLNSPMGIWGDGSSLYVADRGNYRVSKYNASTGAFMGWVGNIASITSIAGGSGCSTATANTGTPAWCTGGTSTSGTGDNMYSNPLAVTGDGTYLYIADAGNNRVARVFLSTGAFDGWIGKISTAPTAGTGSCAGAAAGTFTPGWCKGGVAVAGSGDGPMSGPNAIAYFGGNLYVVDANNLRVNQYNASTAGFNGWIGGISTSPTGGAAGCSGAAAGAPTPGWCLGGATQSGIGDGFFNVPSGIAVEGTFMYVADSKNMRVSRYDMNGAFKGWRGSVATTPAGGDPGCGGTAVGTPTPGWCTGGTAAQGAMVGSFNGPSYLFTDSPYVYSADTGNARVQRFGK